LSSEPPSFPFLFGAPFSPPRFVIFHLSSLSSFIVPSFFSSFSFGFSEKVKSSPPFFLDPLFAVLHCVVFHWDLQRFGLSLVTAAVGFLAPPWCFVVAASLFCFKGSFVSVRLCFFMFFPVCLFLFCYVRLDQRLWWPWTWDSLWFFFNPIGFVSKTRKGLVLLNPKGFVVTGLLDSSHDMSFYVSHWNWLCLAAWPLRFSDVPDLLRSASFKASCLPPLWLSSSKELLCKLIFRELLTLGFRYHVGGQSIRLF